MDDIRAWLSGNRNYESGAKLYLQHGKDHALRRVFLEPASDFKKKLLYDALKGLLAKKVERVHRVEETKAVTIERVAKAPRKWPKEKDATVQALYLKWKPLFAEMMSLMARIYDVALAGKTDTAKKAEAGAMAHRILDLDDECDSLYDQRDHYLKHNKLPDSPGPMELVVDPVKIPMALANAQRYVRDYKNKMKKNPANARAAEQLKKWEWAEGEYKRQLKLV